MAELYTVLSAVAFCVACTPFFFLFFCPVAVCFYITTWFWHRDKGIPSFDWCHFLDGSFTRISSNVTNKRERTKIRILILKVNNRNYSTIPRIKKTNSQNEILRIPNEKSLDQIEVPDKVKVSIEKMYRWSKSFESSSNVAERNLESHRNWNISYFRTWAAPGFLLLRKFESVLTSFVNLGSLPSRSLETSILKITRGALLNIVLPQSWSLAT